MAGRGPVRQGAWAAVKGRAAACRLAVRYAPGPWHAIILWPTAKTPPSESVAPGQDVLASLHGRIVAAKPSPQRRRTRLASGRVARL